MHPIIALIILLITFYVIAKIVDEVFIKSLDNIAHTLKLPHDVAGATLLAIGTSAPELSTTLFALFLMGANPATGLGTVVGSAIFQILVVVGFAAMIKTSYLNWKPVIRDGVFYAISVFLLILVVNDNKITFAESAVLVSGYFVYLVILGIYSKIVGREEEKDPIDIVEEEVEKAKANDRSFLGSILRIVSLPIDFLIELIPDPEKYKRWTVPTFFISLGVIAFGSYWLVTAGEAFAIGIGIVPTIVALTILAGGTSVPELISSAIVSKQGRGDMAISNAIGSNSFDILISLGLPLLIYTGINGDLTNIGGENISSSVILLFATMIMILVLLVSQKFKIGRVFGGFLIFCYVLYVIAAYTGIL